MNNELLEKVKSNINSEVVFKFRMSDIETYNFIPVDLKGGFFYAAVTDKADKRTVTAYIKNTLNVDIKFISVDLDVYVLLYNYVKNILNEQKSQNGSKGKKKIGEILIEEGALTEEQLEKALAVGKEKGIPIGSMLVQMGYVSIETLKDALSKQQGYDVVDADQLKLDPAILSILPEDFIKTNMVIPISADAKSIVVGMVNPNDKRVLNDIIFLTGLNPRVMLITYFEFKTCMQNYYNESAKETTQIIKKLEQESLQYEIEESLWDQVDRELKDTTGAVVEFANKIVTNALESGASDIHIEPRIDGYKVRYRIDGILSEVMALPQKVEQAVLTRFKVLARMNIAEHRRPQDGTCSMSYKGLTYDLRLNTLPVYNKEKMVIRILAPAVSIENQDKSMNISGLSKSDYNLLKKMTLQPNGIILASGPTGSGKTTTLYQILLSLNDEKVNITTIEDPVEIKIDGINQSQVNTKAGITFASCMRSILRQDPDIILVGEIRDFETLEVAISASLTGHLVLSTIHTNSAAATITRLIEMGAKGYLVASTLTGVIAQRLVRRLCPICKEKYVPTDEELKSIIPPKCSLEEARKATFYRAKGCAMCNHEGYNGRLGVFEILPITKEIKKLIAVGAHDIEIEDIAIASGMNTLYDSCFAHILAGETTISEFIRVLGLTNE